MTTQRNKISILERAIEDGSTLCKPTSTSVPEEFGALSLSVTPRNLQQSIICHKTVSGQLTKTSFSSFVHNMISTTY